MTMVAEQTERQALPERWSGKAKTDVILRLLRGEAIDAVSRGGGVRCVAGGGGR